ncbi:MAG: biotin synthase BioB [Spirochaetota bacterium]
MQHRSADIESAYTVLDGRPIDEALASRLIDTPSAYAMDLYSLANKVRMANTPSYDACSIVNAKSGACSEDCAFCAQSGSNNAAVEIYPLMDEASLLAKAREAKANGASAFSIVTSGCGYETPSPELRRIITAIERIRDAVGIDMHASLGILGDESLTLLKAAGVSMIHHNLETAPSHFMNICTSHTIDARIATVKRAKAHGFRVCCGGILGLGESPRQRVELAFAIRSLSVDAIPINVLNRLDGTRIERHPISIREIMNAVAVFRLINPKTIIKIAAGRESALADWQGLVFNAGANSMLIGGYLTTRGRAVALDRELIDALEGF